MSQPPKAPPRFVPTLTEVVQVADVLPVPVPVGTSSAGSTQAKQQLSKQFEVGSPVPPERPRARGPESESSVQYNMPAAPVSRTAYGPAPAARSLPQGMEEYMVHRVMQRVDVVLDQRLREAIALVVQEQTRSLLPRLREEVESVVRHAVYEAVADELAGSNSAAPLR
nr:hypothetical protein [Acidovorax delafieldii]